MLMQEGIRLCLSTPANLQYGFALSELSNPDILNIARSETVQ